MPAITDCHPFPWLSMSKEAFLIIGISLGSRLPLGSPSQFTYFFIPGQIFLKGAVSRGFLSFFYFINKNQAIWAPDKKAEMFFA